MSETKVLHEWTSDGASFRVSKFAHSPTTVVEYIAINGRDWLFLGTHHVGDEIARLAADNARLTRELSEAREAIYTAPIETDGSGCYKGRAIEWFDLPAVRAVIEEGKR